MKDVDIITARTLAGITPDFIRKVIESLDPELLEMNEYELEKLVEHNPFVNRVRNAFWQEYERAQGGVRKMNIHNVAVAVGSLEQHIKRLFKHDMIAAWILCPPTSYIIFLDEALDFGLKRLRDHILTLPLRDEMGAVDHENANLILKTVAFLDMRKNGAVVQKTMNLNVNTTKADMKDVSKEMSLLDLDKKIQELEEKQKRVDKRINRPEVEEAETT